MNAKPLCQIEQADMERIPNEGFFEQPFRTSRLPDSVRPPKVEQDAGYPSWLDSQTDDGESYATLDPASESVLA